MKSSAFMAITADQLGSRRSSDRVPAALDALSGVEGIVLPFERTAGDEVQALTARASTVVEVVARLSRLGGWRVGLGLGDVELPLPTSTREARGTAYLNARTAVESAGAPADLRLVAVGANGHHGGVDPIVAAETVFWLLRAIWGRRTPQGWEVADMLDARHTASEVASMLGVSASAISQRSSTAHLTEERRARDLLVELLVAAGLDR